MGETYRLVFRGEVLEGQHRAVVRRRLTELMRLSEPQVEKLFSGDPVVLKSDVDRKTAARYQTLFKQAGGRLQVVAQRTAEPAAPSGLATAPRLATDPNKAASGPVADSASGDAPGFTVIANYAPPPEAPRAEIEAPDFDIAAVGTNLADAVAPSPVDVPEADFELAAVGVNLLARPRPAEAIEVPDADFDIAEVGATIGVASPEATVEPPDTTRLKLLDN